jgi:ribonuclease-3
MTKSTREEVTPQEFMDSLGVKYRNFALLVRALTHRSYLNENPGALEDNERLEFLGDAVLDFIVASWLYHHYPEMTEGELTQVRTAVVCTEQLAVFGRMIELGSAMRLGQGEVLSGGRDRDALICAGFEALIGSYYLDQGISAVEKFFFPFLENAVNKIMVNGHPRDPKSLLQEWTQARSITAPEYITIAEKGPDHDKQFVVEVRVEGYVSASGAGHNKRDASKAAAAEALEIIQNKKLIPRNNKSI